MKKLFFIAIVLLGISSCSETEPDQYTGRELNFELFKSSDYDFTGTMNVKELVAGGLELTLRMNGVKANSDYSYPAHLHFGSYDQADAPIAFMLNPVSAKTLESNTILGKLSDGSQLDFEAMRMFDGHVKIHLANEGPDYQVILVAGNVGANPSAFNPDDLAICGKGF
ncbi:hypothetical protein DFQ04_1008 [Algoriphagus boseongensis]|uniref:CHRD domain-containing protein n=1 Tax=Algoriphagus boseongensis TaxID=1442587 RepID=A0A4R6T8Z3_9BACT|nr:hypothetical protein [Algoriphagus boseongensis]TDQ19191.1 hypothetical protein DFQ04_1008 [Algoriphagus boseongensis]